MSGGSGTTDFGPAAAEFPEPFRLLVREEVSSTNDELRALACAGAAHGLVLISHRQTAGRGRRGAAWFAGEGTALAFSVLLRPEEPPGLWPRLSLAAGVALAETLDHFRLAPGLKWPNDVWLNRKKAAGILLEGGDGFVIAGIGLNVNTIDFPPEIAEIATSMRISAGRLFDPAEVFAKLIARFAVNAAMIGNDFPQLLSALRERCVLTGERVSLRAANGLKTGKILGIGSHGELLFDCGGGVEPLVQADEVRIIS